MGDMCSYLCNVVLSRFCCMHALPVVYEFVYTSSAFFCSSMAVGSSPAVSLVVLVFAGCSCWLSGVVPEIHISTPAQGPPATSVSEVSCACSCPAPVPCGTESALPSGSDEARYICVVSCGLILVCLALVWCVRHQQSSVAFQLAETYVEHHHDVGRGSVEPGSDSGVLRIRRLRRGRGTMA